MKITVTGGSGHTGRGVVEQLLESGHSVLIVDRVPPRDTETPYKLCNLEDFGETVGVLEGCDAIVHLAAIPRPIYHPNSVVFRTNILAAYNVFEAAATLGIQRVIYTSSISVTGYPFYHRFFEPEYVPIDENHPPAPQDSYGLSKYLGEEIGKAFVRRTGMKVISLRMPWIHTPESYARDVAPFRHDPQFGASNLWAYVDSRDVGQSVSLSLDVDLEGFHAFFISAPDTFMETPSRELVEAFYPHSEIRPGFGGSQSLLSSAKAEKILGFKAEYTWQDYE